jgi:hypothetical protein
MVFHGRVTLNAWMTRHTSTPFSKDDFDRLAAVCRDALQTARSADEVALSHLHLRNYHPEHLSSYGNLAGEAASASGWVRKVLRQAALPILGAIKRPRWCVGDALPKQTDILFLSHFNSIAQCKSAGDVYFGGIPKQVQEALGRSALVASIDHTWLGQAKILSEWIGDTVPRVVLSRLSNSSQELGFARRLRRAARSKAYPSNPIGRGLQRLISRDPITGPALTALRTGAQVEQLVRVLKPKLVIATYEGHPWERLAFQSARKAKPDIVCVGYHHTMLVPGTSCAGWGVGSDFNPDVIMTSGDLAKTWFKQQPDLNGISIQTLGSIKALTMEGAGKPAPAGQSCLVAPEGILSETLLLLGLAFRTAKRLPGQKFVIRLHPVLGRKTVERALGTSSPRPTNVQWSNESLDHDLEHASSLLYRGSSVVFNAVRAGVRPIYFALDRSSFSIDPMEPVEQGWRRTVASDEDLADVLSGPLGKVGWDACKAHSDANFAPVNLRPLASLFQG